MEPPTTLDAMPTQLEADCLRVLQEAAEAFLSRGFSQSVQVMTTMKVKTLTPEIVRTVDQIKGPPVEPQPEVWPRRRRQNIKELYGVVCSWQ